MQCPTLYDSAPPVPGWLLGEVLGDMTREKFGFMLSIIQNGLEQVFASRGLHFIP